MLYLFGSLALSDSLFYHENFQDDELQENTVRNRHLEGPEANVRAAIVSRRLRRGRHLLLRRFAT